MFNKILVATGRPDNFDAPELTAIQIAAKYNSKLYFLHVIESGKRKDRYFMKHFKTGKNVFFSNDYVQAVGHQIKRYCDEIIAPDLKYKIKVIPGSPGEEIITWAHQEYVDIILMGGHTESDRKVDETWLKRTIGRTVQDVIIREHYPVMIVSRAVPEEKLKFKKIMVSIDFSESCKTALFFAANLAQRNEAKLFVYYMAPACPWPRGRQTDYRDIADIMQHRFDKLCHIIPDETEYKFEEWEGIMSHIEILKYADQKDIDLIVLGSHTEDTNERLYTGSTLEGVSCKADCPVIVISGRKI